MEYRGIWTVFFGVLLLMGVSVYFLPAFVIRSLGHRGESPSEKFVKVWRFIGLFVAIISLAELVSVIRWGKRF
jgi:hypothetical protein